MRDYGISIDDDPFSIIERGGAVDIDVCVIRIKVKRATKASKLQPKGRR